MNLVIFHEGCADGAGAAWCIWKAFGDAGTEYRAAQYGDPAPADDEVRGKAVFIVDFSYPAAEIERLCASAWKVHLIDHHKSAVIELQEHLSSPWPENLTLDLDYDRSGARMTWDRFSAGMFPDKQPQDPGDFTPMIAEKQRGLAEILINYIQDRDLWRWKMPFSKEVNTALVARSIQRDFKVLEYLIQNVTLTELTEEGRAIVRYQDGIIDTLTHQAREVVLAGHKVLAANAPVLQSEVGERLAQDRPFGIAWFMKWDGSIVVSLRSRGESGIDVSELAKTFAGGGGHARAAGFQWTDRERHECAREWPWEAPR